MFVQMSDGYIYIDDKNPAGDGVLDSGVFEEFPVTYGVDSCGPFIGIADAIHVSLPGEIVGAMIQLQQPVIHFYWHTAGMNQASFCGTITLDRERLLELQGWLLYSR